MQISGVSLALTWPRKVCLLRVLCVMPLLQAFPFPSTLGEVTLHLLSPAWCVYLQLTWVVGLLPSPVEFSSLCHSHKLSRSWLLGARTRSHRSLSGQAWLVNLQFHEGFPSPLFGSQGAPPSFLRVFIVFIAYYSVSPFSPGGGRSVQGAMLIWPRVVCGSTAATMKLTLSESSQAIWVRVTGGPPGFSV
jgi:hypothetical protein